MGERIRLSASYAINPTWHPFEQVWMNALASHLPGA
jgi:hypothetical protein